MNRTDNTGIPPFHRGPRRANWMLRWATSAPILVLALLLLRHAG